MDEYKIKQIIEAAILAADNPLDRDGMLILFDEDDRPDKETLNRLLDDLAEDYAERGVELREVGSGFRFQVRNELGPWVSRLWAERAPRYSRAIMETLALIAYRQPVTRGEIEEVRGVSVGTQIIRTLQERGWVRVVGYRDVPGRPAMFATTKQFLDYFNLASLDELPALSEIKDLDKLNEELELEEGESAGGEETESAGEEGALEAHADSGGDEGPPAANDEAAAEGEGGELPAGWQDEDPDIDESQLMEISKVDAVLEDVEATFRKKPGEEHKLEPGPNSEAQSAEPEAAAESGEAEQAPAPDDDETRTAAEAAGTEAEPDPAASDDAGSTETDPDHE